MNSKIKLNLQKLPQAIAELSHSNQFLKMSAFSSYVLCGLLITVLFYQAIKPIPVLTLAPDGNVYQQAPKLKAEIEIERAIREYVKLRYNWDPKTVNQKIDQADAFVAANAKKAFDQSMKNVVKFSTEKLVSQKAYPEKINIDLKTQEARVTGDRVTAIQGMKAAGDLNLKLIFESGPRTLANPWGIYIQREIETN